MFLKEIYMRRFAMLSAALFAAALIAGPASAAELTGTLKKIQDTGVVKIGNRDASIPFSYLDDNQKPIGYGVDICLRIVDAIKAELKMPNLIVEFVPVTSQTRIPILTGGNIDLECGSTTNSVERQKQVDYAPTYFLTGTKIIVKKSSGIKGYDDLKGKTVVYTQGTTNERAMKAYNDEKKLGINFIPAKDHAESFLSVETGRAAAFPMDDILLYSLRASAKNPADYEVIGEFLSDDPYGIMMRKNDPAFKKLVDDAVTKIYSSGEINKIYHKWFESKIPPKGINLGFPMSDALKEVIKHPNNNGVEACGKMKC
jgi:glutamate/aspartate transport system substrate-binding protein